MRNSMNHFRENRTTKSLMIGITSITIFSTFFVLFLTNCKDNYDDGRNDKITYFYIKGFLINANSGTPVDGMSVELIDIDRNMIRSVDSICKNGSYLVYQYYNSDPHVAHLSDAHLIASNEDFFGDSVIHKYSVDTLNIDILVKPVGKIIVKFNNLDNIQSVGTSTCDRTLLNGVYRNSSLFEFNPTSSDTTIILSAYPDRQNGFYCWFNEFIPGEYNFDSTFFIKSGDTIYFDIND
jgi:hypothetical protein